MNGLGYKERGNVVNYYSGVTDINPTKNTNVWNSLLIANDGTSDIVLEVNGMSMTIKFDEVLDEDFIGFTTFSLTTNGNSYRMWLRE